MKKRPTKNYLVIGTAHLGMDKAVLRVMANAAKYYKAQVIHTGPLATIQEIDMWKRRIHKIRVWEDMAKVKENEIDIEAKYKKKQLERDVKATEELIYESEHPAQISKLKEKIKKMKVADKALVNDIADKHKKLQDKTNQLMDELRTLEEIQLERIQTLEEIFGKKLLFVCNDELMVPNTPEGSVVDYLGSRYVDKRLSLGDHLYVTATPANGDKVSGMPITDRTFKMLSNMKSSNIIAHMTPNTRPFARPGINQAYNFFTTGSLQVHDHPKRVSDAYKSAAKPSCMLVSVDETNGEFHPQRLRVKLIRSEVSHKLSPHIIHDSVVFDASGEIIELGSEDRALHQTDLHAPYENLGVVAACRTLNTLHMPSIFIDGGDSCDFSSVSRHTKHSPGSREGLRLIDDVMSGVRMFDAVSNGEEFPWIKEKVLLDSNHAEWVTNFVDENPSLKGICDWETLAKTFFPDWNVFIRTGGSDKFYTFGDLTIKHADKEQSVSKAQNIYGNYLGGHHHRYEEIGDAMFVGPGCSLGPKYLQNSATSWQNQITTLSKYKKVTCKHPKTILHSEDKKLSRFVYQGQIFEVNFHSYTK